MSHFLGMFIRQLSASELGVWLDFVSSVFVNTPRDYFKRHIENDPDTAPHTHILVAVEDPSVGKVAPLELQQIMGTLRIFQRVLIHSGQRISVGGIGEVSVSPRHQRKGIATLLLKEARAHMAEGNPSPIPGTDLVLSTLHTGEAAPLYRSVGYESIPLSYSQLQMVFTHPYSVLNSEGCNLRPTPFSSEDIGVRLMHFQHSVVVNMQIRG
jgi:ribosomal protein S18 acetylase RimI-like enzyme